ncbi:hypothetical protein [Cupriavidus nantongensis]|uniref:hypothetical protein n=1 Tax=Cupriavidus nantongensis TaxID=1796606 RepID=UPI00358E6EA7
MTNINQFLRDNLGKVSKNMLVAPDIPEKKLNNAVKAFSHGDSISYVPSHVVALFDNTLFGSAKEGLLFTGERVIYRETFGDPIGIPYATVDAVRPLPTAKDDTKMEGIAVSLKGGGSVQFKNLLECDYVLLAKILNSATQSFEEYKEEKQFVPISEMSEALKVAYLKLIVNMAVADDATIDRREFAEILMLMTRLDLATESRFALRGYMASPEALAPVEALVGELDAACPDGQERSVHVSLVKDLINVYLSTGGKDVKEFAFLNMHRSLWKVTNDEIDLAQRVIRNDHNMINEDFSDDQIVAALKDISARAAAVGTPLAAVYLSGSVIGLSAAGMTSGLAALGMGGFLGLSSMATGIGVAVLIGVGTYAGIKKLTGANELTRARRRELMLQEVIKQTQSTISLLIGDINYMTTRLNEAVQAHGTQDAKVRELLNVITQMTAAGTVLRNRAEDVQSSATRLRCAANLDLDKLRMLTREPTKADLCDFISGFYEEREMTVETNGQKSKVKRMVIRRTHASRELETLARAFEAIGYFNVGDVLMGSAMDAAGKAKDKIAGLFS